VTSASHADVVVIGAGIAGASAAWELAKELDVTLIELEPQPGLHATGRSAAVITETYGPPTSCALAAASRPFLQDPPAEVSEWSLLSPRGLLWVASPEWVGAIGRIVENAQAVGTPLEPMDATAACGMVPVLRSDWLATALYEPTAMSIDVARLLERFRGCVSAQWWEVASLVTGNSTRLAGPWLARRHVGRCDRLRVGRECGGRMGG
jgi:D-arginine dehydrogenase